MKITFSNTLKTLLSAGITAALLSAPSYAWPDKTVTLVVPFPPGGSSDLMARTLAPKLQEKWGQSVIVDNKGGATGTIGAGFVKRAAPDGHTLLVTSLGPLVIVPHLVKGLPYDAAKDFDYLTVGVQSPNVLVVPAASPYTSLAEVIAALKAKPDKLSFVSSGNGSSDHLTAELFWLQTGTSGVHVPYKGGAPAITDLIGGQVDASFANINSVIQHINNGKLRPLVITSSKRSPLLPNVPTFEELGMKDLTLYAWQAVAAPKGLPADVKAKIHAGLVETLNDPQLKKKFVDVGFEVVGNTPEQFTAFQQKESSRWKHLIDTRKITAD